MLFLQHGMTKIFSYPLSSASSPTEWSLLWVAGLLELIGSLMLLVGLFLIWRGMREPLPPMIETHAPA